MTGRLFLFLGAAATVILVAGVYLTSTSEISVGNLVADFGAVLGFSDKNEGELVAVIPLDKSDGESAIVTAKIQDNKSIRQLAEGEPKKTESKKLVAITPPPAVPAAQDTNITEQSSVQQPLTEAQPQPITAPEPASQEPVFQEATPEPIQQVEAIKVLISEIQAGTTQNGIEDEFIELYNPTNRTIDMKEWSLIKKASSGSPYNLVSSAKFSGSIAPKSFFLVAHANYKGVKSADLIYSANSNNIAYKDNAVVLYDETEVVIDEVSWSEIPKDNSLERKALVSGVCVSAQNENELIGNGCDTDNANDFELRIIPNPQNTFDAAE